LPSDVDPFDGVTCASGEVACGDGFCINEGYVCDGEIDCPNEADEQNCRKYPWVSTINTLLTLVPVI
jgi:hypothetical protein